MLAKKIPHFLLGVTKENVTVFTVNAINEMKVYKTAEKMAQEELESMLKDNHHVIDSRGVAYLKQMLKDNIVIDKDLVEDLIKQESNGGIDNLLKNLSSKPLLISILHAISAKIIAYSLEKDQHLVWFTY